MTSIPAPGSAIARSEFALAQRDAVRAKAVVSKTVLQASVPLVVKIAPIKTRILPKVKTLPQTAGTVSQLQTVANPPLSTRLTPLTGPLVPLDPPTRSSQPHLAVPLEKAPLSSGKAVFAPAHSLPKSSPTLLAALPSSKSKDPALDPSVRVGPKVLSSREMKMLRRLDSDLADQQESLTRAESRLTRYQRQLGVFTSVISTAMLENGKDGTGLNPFVRVALRYRGTPYVWGGETARGFDCSGFIMRVMRDLGYRALPHSAAEQFNYGMPVARELLKPGDIVFFANTYKAGVSHVGIYLGQRRFIHAASSKVGTIVSSIDDPKWVQHYAGARRLVTTRTSA